MKPFLAATLTTFCAAIAGLVLIGPNLGTIFWLFAVAALLAPIFTPWRDVLGVLTGLTLAVVTILFRDVIDPRQFFPVLLAVLSFALFAAAIGRVLGVAAAIAISLAWLASPIWLSPWMTDTLASHIGHYHPLLAINMVVPQYGLWIQGPLMYHLTNLGQDVNVDLPDGMTRMVAVHLVVAAFISLPPAGWSWRRVRDEAASAAP